MINKWSETFENADSRKRQRMGWLLLPSGNESAGYIELMSYGDRGIKAFGVFIAICQWSATNRQICRGKLARSDGRVLSPRQIASVIRVDEKTVVDAIELLTDPDVGWLLYKENEESATPCQSSATNLPGLLKEKEKEKEKERRRRGRSTLVVFWNSGRATPLVERPGSRPPGSHGKRRSSSPTRI